MILRCDLKNWAILRVSDGTEYIQGQVFKDHRGRFAPGTYVYSTEITKKVGDWQDLGMPDDGRHVQTAGSTWYFPVGPGRIVDVTEVVATRIRAGQEVDDARKESST